MTVKSVRIKSPKLPPGWNDWVPGKTGRKGRKIKWPTPPGGKHITPFGQEIPMKDDGTFDAEKWDKENE